MWMKLTVACFGLLLWLTWGRTRVCCHIMEGNSAIMQHWNGRLCYRLCTSIRPCNQIWVFCPSGVCELHPGGFPFLGGWMGIYVGCNKFPIRRSSISKKFNWVRKVKFPPCQMSRVQFPENIRLRFLPVRNSLRRVSCGPCCTKIHSGFKWNWINEVANKNPSVCLMHPKLIL